VGAHVYELVFPNFEMKPKHVAKRYIIWLVAGTPGTGKTTLSQKIAPLLHARILEEKTLVRKKGVGGWNTQTKEYDVDIHALKKELLSQIAHTPKNLIIVGHLSCEFSLPVNHVIVTRCPRSTLEKRLRKRKYSEVKIQENLYCEEENYVLERVKKHYSRSKIIVLSTHRPKKGVPPSILCSIRLHTTT
jgi:adenylate kinase